jgi:hypothetical protein
LDDILGAVEVKGSKKGNISIELTLDSPYSGFWCKRADELFKLGKQSKIS